MPESFFSILECELLSRSSFCSQADARKALFAFVEGFCDPLRLHSGLGDRSPIGHERRFHHDQASPMTSPPEHVH
ncbi:hypothetical protein D3273_25920 [Lichenibacterium minor]|uniref:Integrase catalytic domain-containing protein n=2 Tax=Lichenibacterium minor TaxID=2316528 RepID=A0A4Q2U2H5_9HYPH|nr:hypothetical protein D3273_25920 [Lichenibacterium minor]